MNLVYTAIYGGFDKLWQPKVVTEGWDYRCYTDEKIEGGKWEIIHKIIEGVSPVKASKYIKITHPMEEYENILWIDGSIEIIGNLNDFISLLPKGDIVAAKHSCNNTIEKELSACIALKKDSSELMKQQVDRYKGLKDYIHTQNGILLKRKDIKATDIWWEEVKNWSKRDQLSFVWSMKKANQEYSVYSWELTRKYFIWHNKHLTK